MSHQETVISYLKNHKGLTKRTAMVELYIIHLGDVVSELRKKGWRIYTYMRKSENAEYAEYVLVSTVQHRIPQEAVVIRDEAEMYFGKAAEL